jgi:hypothetical protein
MVAGIRALRGKEGNAHAIIPHSGDRTNASATTARWRAHIGCSGGVRTPGVRPPYGGVLSAPIRISENIRSCAGLLYRPLLREPRSDCSGWTHTGRSVLDSHAAPLDGLWRSHSERDCRFIECWVSTRLDRASAADIFIGRYGSDCRCCPGTRQQAAHQRFRCDRAATENCSWLTLRPASAIFAQTFPTKVFHDARSQF